MMASVRTDAYWGVDYMHLAKIDGEWKVVNVLWDRARPRTYVMLPWMASTRVAKNGLRIYYDEHRTGHPLLLLQAGFDTHHIWDSQLPAWKDNVRVITPDSRGRGRTEDPGGQIRYDLLAQDALALVQALGLEKLLICGIADGA